MVTLGFQRMIRVSNQQDSSVVAEAVAHSAPRGSSVHYSKLYSAHAVYCDEDWFTCKHWRWLGYTNFFGCKVVWSLRKPPHLTSAMCPFPTVPGRIIWDAFWAT